MPEISVCVFAHNEALSIQRSVESIVQACAGRVFECHVMANGCSDDTVGIATKIAREDPRIRVHEIRLGDKSNAWNEYVHACAPQAALHVFVDGDCGVDPDAINAFVRALQAHPHANALAGMAPDGHGRNTAAQNHLMRTEGGLSGNLYALPGGFVDRIRRAAIRLPVGFIGDDSLVGALAFWDLEPHKRWDKSLIVACEDANFFYGRLSPFKLRHIRLYLRRRVRYSMRHFQNQIVRQTTMKDGLAGILPTVEALYQARPDMLAVRPRGLDTVFDFFALRRIRGAGR